LPLFGIGVFFVVFLVPLIGTLASVAMTSLRLCCRGAGAPVHHEVKASKKAAARGKVRAMKVKAFCPQKWDGLKNISVG